MDNVLTEENEARKLPSQSNRVSTTIDKRDNRGLSRILGPVFLTGIFIWVLVIDFFI